MTGAAARAIFGNAGGRAAGGYRQKMSGDAGVAGKRSVRGVVFVLTVSLYQRSGFFGNTVLSFIFK